MSRQEIAMDIFAKLGGINFQRDVGATNYQAFTDSNGNSGLKFDIKNTGNFIGKIVNHVIITRLPQKIDVNYYNMEFSYREGEQFHIMWQGEDIQETTLKEYIRTILARLFACRQRDLVPKVA